MSWPAVLANLLYPSTCLLCGASRAPRMAWPGLMCEACASTLPRSGPPVCGRCGLELPGAFDAVQVCARCHSHPPAFEAARAPWRYEGGVRTAIQQWKYHRRWRLGERLAGEMAQTARRSLPVEDIEAVVPVPLHWLKRRVRGWNPSATLAEAVARSLEKPSWPSTVRRRRWTRSQTGLSGRARARNVQGAFVAAERWVRGRSLLLVDDVLTSGATAEACATALKEAGADRVFVLTAARTPLL